MKPTFDIVTSFKNDAQYVDPYIGGLWCLSRQECLKCKRVLLVDDGSTDVTRGRLSWVSCNSFLNVQFIDGVKGRSWIHENFNLVLDRHVQSPYLLRLDADTELTAGYVDSCMRYLRWHPDCYSCGGIVRDMASPKWIRKASLQPSHPWGTARLYDVEKLRTIGGFYGCSWETPLGRIHDEDSATDRVALRHGFRTGIVSNIVAYHWRPLSEAAIYGNNRRSSVFYYALKYHDFRALVDVLLLPSSVFWHAT